MMTPRRSPRTKEPSFTVSAKWVAFIGAAIALVYALNRPVSAFNSLSASVDKLAEAVSRIDVNQTEQGKRIDGLATDGAALSAKVDGTTVRINTIEARISAMELRKK